MVDGGFLVASTALPAPETDGCRDEEIAIPGPVEARGHFVGEPDCALAGAGGAGGAVAVAACVCASVGMR